MKIKSTGFAKGRIHTMDEIRGFAIICMVFFHAFYTMNFMFNIKLGRVLMNFFEPASIYFACGFIVISGISSCLSRSNMKRGIKLLGIALLLTLATCIIGNDCEIYFGILHLLSVCMILSAVLMPIVNKIPVPIGVAVNAVLYYMTYDISVKKLHIPFTEDVILPQLLYKSNWLAPLGMYANGFYSADYYPILPFAFMFFIGVFIGRYAKQGKFPKFMYKRRVPFLSYVGKHTLIIYIAHQPVIYALITLCEYLFK